MSDKRSSNQSSELSEIRQIGLETRDALRSIAEVNQNVRTRIELIEQEVRGIRKQCEFLDAHVRGDNGDGHATQLRLLNRDIEDIRKDIDTQSEAIEALSQHQKESEKETAQFMRNTLTSLVSAAVAIAGAIATWLQANSGN